MSVEENLSASGGILQYTRRTEKSLLVLFPFNQFMRFVALKRDKNTYSAALWGLKRM